MPLMAELRRLLLGSSNNKEDNGEWVGGNTAQGETLWETRRTWEKYGSRKKKKKKNRMQKDSIFLASTLPSPT